MSKTNEHQAHCAIQDVQAHSIPAEAIWFQRGLRPYATISLTTRPCTSVKREVAPGVTVRQLGVVQPQLVQYRRMQVVQVHPILDSHAMLVAASEAHPALDPAASHPHGVAAVVVAPSIALVVLLVA